jgi:hypothetical protein
MECGVAVIAEFPALAPGMEQWSRRTHYMTAAVSWRESAQWLVCRPKTKKSNSCLPAAHLHFRGTSFSHLPCTMPNRGGRMIARTPPSICCTSRRARLTIIAPTVVASPYRRFELESFLAREANTWPCHPVFPILYSKVPTRRQSDRALSLIAMRQYADWREFNISPSNRRK